MISNVIISSDCGEQKDCLRCDSGKGSKNGDDSWAPRCIKCAHLIVMGSRQCVDKCPTGYREDWSNFVSYMGRICYGECLHYTLASFRVNYGFDKWGLLDMVFEKGTIKSERKCYERYKIARLG